MKVKFYSISEEREKDFLELKKDFLELKRKSEELKEELDYKLIKYADYQERIVKYNTNIIKLKNKISDSKNYINKIKNKNILKKFSIKHNRLIPNDYDKLINIKSIIINKKELSTMKENYRIMTIKFMDDIENKLSQVIKYFRIRRISNTHGTIYDIEFPFDGEFINEETKNTFIQYAITIIKIISNYIKSYVLYNKLKELYCITHTNFTLNDVYDLLQILFKDKNKINDKDNKNKNILELITMFRILPSIYGAYNNEDLLYTNL
jgi:hypothetical protein